jgi:hypothetical protein
MFRILPALFALGEMVIELISQYIDLKSLQHDLEVKPHTKIDTLQMVDEISDKRRGYVPNYILMMIINRMEKHEVIDIVKKYNELK